MYLQDGHHRTAMALLRGDQYIEVDVMNAYIARKSATDCTTVFKTNPYHDASGAFTSKEKAVDPKGFRHGEDFEKAREAVEGGTYKKPTKAMFHSTQVADNAKLRVETTHGYYSTGAAAAALPKIKEFYEPLGGHVTQHNSQVKVLAHLRPKESSGRTKTDDQIRQEIHHQDVMSLFEDSFSQKQPRPLTGFEPADLLRMVDIASEGHQAKYKFVKERWHVRTEASKVFPEPSKENPEVIERYLLSKGFIAERKPDEVSDWRTTELKANLNRGLMTDALSKQQIMKLTEIMPEYLKSNTAKYAMRLDTDFLKEKDFADDEVMAYADRLARARENTDLTPEQKERLRSAESEVWHFSKSYEAVLPELLSGWSISGGTRAQKIIQKVSEKAFSTNDNGLSEFWQDPNNMWADKMTYSHDRMAKHLRMLKSETEAFYKAKLASKKMPNPDLSQIPIKLMRGVGGYVEAYTPAGAESWTTDKSTPKRFGKLMSRSRDKEYSVLETDATYADVLWTYESVHGKPGWPEEKDLKGKKEYVLLGGGIRSVKVTHE
jgi:hypothetical protein